MADTPTPDLNAAQRQATDLPVGLRRKLALTHAALVWERVWPLLLTPLCIAGLYVALALINIWDGLPGALHWLAALATLGGIGWFAYQAYRHYEHPTREQALRRLETRSGLTHRPLSALADARAGFAGGRDAGATLWAHHLAGLRAAADRARIAPPRSNTARTDVYALRAVVFLLVVAALAYAGRDAPARLAANLLPGPAFGSGQAIAFDAWLTPPAYTGVPPLFLDTADMAARNSALPLKVPTGSVLTARVYGASSAGIRHAGTTHAFDAETSGTREINLPLSESGTLNIRADGRVLDTFNIDLTPDFKPQISFTEGNALSVTAQLSLAVGYDLQDDYGVTAAEMRITLPVPADDVPTPQTAQPQTAEPQAAEPADTPAPDIGALAAIDPPVLKLPLPGARVTAAEAEFAYKDLTSHPWAGLQVAITLAAFDEAGQEGTSSTRIMRLPQRRFTDPVARAVIEQRQRLARAPDEAAQVATALNALTLHADRYYDHANDYLPLRAAYWRLKGATHSGDAEGIYDLLWHIALHFEDGDLSLAETALRDAQDALMDALANDATDAEIERLMGDLRAAMEEFLQALAQQQMQQGADGQMAPMDPNTQAIQQGDLESLLDALQDLAQSGSRDAARQLLSELRQMMENLTTGTPGQSTMTPPQSAMNDAIGQMGEIIDQQRTLQDETVQRDNSGAQQGLPPQGQSGEGQPGGRPGEGEAGEGEAGEGAAGEGAAGEGRSGTQPGNPPGGGMSGLKQRQEILRGELGDLRTGLDGTGVDSPSALGRADRAMRDAEQALKDGDLGRAARKQGEAIENLRDGAQALAETLLKELAMSGEGQGQERGQGPEGRDPLGRPQRSSGPQIGDGVEVPDETDIQRARRILEELQRRSGDRSRPPVELDYLNRLLQRF